jgi:PncC family amidohydrolase
MTNSLYALAEQIAAGLTRTGRQLVLAESCTAGLVAASLGSVPGISQHLCGSAVVYQERTKSAWLGVPQSLFADPGVVSAEVAKTMTAKVLEQTPYADLAASVTGHLGPHAPAELDGLIYIAVQDRDQPPTVIERRLPARLGTPPDVTRRERQIAAAETVLQALLSTLA